MCSWYTGLTKNESKPSRLTSKVTFQHELEMMTESRPLQRWSTLTDMFTGDVNSECNVLRCGVKEEQAVQLCNVDSSGILAKWSGTVHANPFCHIVPTETWEGANKTWGCKITGIFRFISTTWLLRSLLLIRDLCPLSYDNPSPAFSKSTEYNFLEWD